MNIRLFFIYVYKKFFIHVCEKIFYIFLPHFETYPYSVFFYKFIDYILSHKLEYYVFVFNFELLYGSVSVVLLPTSRQFNFHQNNLTWCIDLLLFNQKCTPLVKNSNKYGFFTPNLLNTILSEMMSIFPFETKLKLWTIFRNFCSRKRKGFL